MRTLLLNLPWSRDGRFGVRAGSRWPFTAGPEDNGYIKYIPFPFFLAYAAALLIKHGHGAELIDSIADRTGVDGIAARIEAYRPGLIVIETSTPSFRNDIAIAAALAPKIPGARLALCGPHATVFARDLLRDHPFVDYIVMGEYEYTLLELADRLEGNGSLTGVKGLAHRSGGRPAINRPRAPIARLDDLPWPLRDAAVIHSYNDGFAGLPVPNVQMSSSRGCPFRCTFCLWPQTLYRGRAYRKRDPVKVVDEMEYLIRTYGFKAVYFDDDTFNADRRHVTGICAEIKKRRLVTSWGAMARADLMDARLLDALAGAGMFAVKYGIESVNAKILKACKKGMNTRRIKETIRYTKKSGIKVHLTFCIGLPGETAATIRENMDFIREVQPDSFQLSLATPFPGTGYYDLLAKNGGLLSKEWDDYDGNKTCIVRTDALSAAELERFKNDLDRHRHV
jgi:anaerobic magnesium-protoporphyrin IX monomethyl ester cyclase